MHAINTKGYDVSVDVFLRKLMRFLHKKWPNFVPNLLLKISLKKTVCGSVVDHYQITVEIHQITQAHKKVNKIQLKPERRMHTHNRDTSTSLASFFLG